MVLFSTSCLHLHIINACPSLVIASKSAKQVEKSFFAREEKSCLSKVERYSCRNEYPTCLLINSCFINVSFFVCNSVLPSRKEEMNTANRNIRPKQAKTIVGYTQLDNSALPL